MASQQNEFSLSELSCIALGTPEIEEININVLHNLMGSLLKKMDCLDETVTIGSTEAKWLQTMLDESKPSPIKYNDDQITVLSTKFDQIEELEERFKTVDAKLTKHLDAVMENSKTADIEFDLRAYDLECDDMTTTCGPLNEMACRLLRNDDFMAKMLRRISKPMINQFFSFEESIEKLHTELLISIGRLKAAQERLGVLEYCLELINNLETKVDDHYMIFLGAMEEIQEMLDIKLGKLHVPALKKYVRDAFAKLEKNILTIEQQKTCPKPAGIIKRGIRCICCGSINVGAEVGVQPVGALPEFNVKKPRKIKNKICKCIDIDEGTKVHEFSVVLEAVKDKYHPKGFNVPVRGDCKPQKYTLDLFEGADGSFYRWDSIYQVSAK